jgi:hypothetical protein
MFSRNVEQICGIGRDNTKTGISIPGSGGLEERDALSVLGRDALDDDMRSTLQSYRVANGPGRFRQHHKLAVSVTSSECRVFVS